MSENWRQSEIRIAVCDEGQGRIGKHLSGNGLIAENFISQFADERIFKIGEHLAKVQAK